MNSPGEKHSRGRRAGPPKDVVEGCEAVGIGSGQLGEENPVDGAAIGSRCSFLWERYDCN